jgi:hypothetical protein
MSKRHVYVEITEAVLKSIKKASRAISECAGAYINAVDNGKVDSGSKSTKI